MGKTKTFLKAIALAVCVAAFMQPAAALAESVNFGSEAFAATGSTPTSIPIGAAQFCQDHRTDCRPNAHVVTAVPLTQALWSQLLNVNSHFNDTIVPETDEQLYHVAEFWTYPHGYGDCEDYALAKRRALIRDGWPASALLMTVVRQENGEGHAVLMVRTDRGDLILDNQSGLVRVWSDTPYHYLKRQSQADPAEWVNIYDKRPIRIASR